VYKLTRLLSILILCIFLDGLFLLASVATVGGICFWRGFCTDILDIDFAIGFINFLKHVLYVRTRLRVILQS